MFIHFKVCVTMRKHNDHRLWQQRARLVTTTNDDVLSIIMSDYLSGHNWLVREGLIKHMTLAHTISIRDEIFQLPIHIKP